METHLPTHLAGSNCYIYWSYKWSEQFIKCFLHTQVKGLRVVSLYKFDVELIEITLFKVGARSIIE